MKQSGIIRRIDDLGRVVIPKNIRYAAGIVNGDPLEFFVNGEDVVLRKYKVSSDTSTAIQKLIVSIGDDYMIDKPTKEAAIKKLQEAQEALNAKEGSK